MDAMDMWMWWIGATGTVIATIYMLLRGWRRFLPAPPLPLSAQDRKSVRWWLIGSLALGLPAGYTLVEMGGDLSNHVWAGCAVLTQFPIILVVSLTVDAIYRHR
jgi:hypothetical protein